jgi:hypothetical protein
MNIDNLDPDIKFIGFTDEEEAALVAFMKALTDPRVNEEKAPFDHPELFIPNGHVGNEDWVLSIDGKRAKDDLIKIPAVGRFGRSVLGLPKLSEVGFNTKLAQ